MIRNMPIRSKLIAVLLLPLLALAALAAIGIRANVARGVQADRQHGQGERAKRPPPACLGSIHHRHLLSRAIPCMASGRPVATMCRAR